MINGKYTSDQNGMAEFYLRDGNYTLTAYDQANTYASKSLVVAGADIGIDIVFQSQPVTCHLSESGVLTISGNGPIPNSLNQFDSRYRQYRYETKEIVIGDGITEIGNYAFEDFKNLTTVKLPESLKRISESAFSGCEKLEDVVLPNNILSIEHWAFRNCKSLTSITIPESLVLIEDEAFYGCTGLEKIYWNAVDCYVIQTFSLGSNYYAVFSTSSSAGAKPIDIIFGENVETIPSYLCKNCTAIKTITVGKNVKKIGGNTFKGCTGLEKIYWNAEICEDANPSYVPFADAGALTGDVELIFGDQVQQIPANLAQNFSNLRSVRISESVKSIGSGAFRYCTGLTSITLPESVTSIGSSAFSHCTGLTNISLPKSVTSIGYDAFACCTGLTSITLPENIKDIGSKIFSGCTGLKKIYWNVISCNDLTYESLGWSDIQADSNHTIELIFGENVEYIPECICYKCPYIKAVICPKSIKSIGAHAFSDCTGLTSITLPENLTSLEKRVFFGCTSLTSITLPEGLTSIGNSAFAYCTGLTSITLPENLTSIEESVFSGCTSLTSITLPENLTSIEESVFSGCTSLTSITLPEGVTNIGSSAFSGCTGLEEIFWNIISCNSGKARSILDNVGSPEHECALIFGESVKTIPANLCYGKNYISSVVIKSATNSIDEYTFKGCTALEKIYLDEIPTDNSYGFVRQIAEGSEKKIDLVFGNNVSEIPNGLCNACRNLSSVTLPENVTSIGNDAFVYCTGLTSITLPESVTNIGDNTFYGCTGLTNITIPESVTSIEEGAFAYCTGLTSITIPEGVTNIEAAAFKNCTGLKTVYWNAVNCRDPKQDLSVFYTTWDASIEFDLVIGDQVQHIPAYLANSCTIKSLTVGKSVTSIGKEAFHGRISEKIYWNAVNCSDAVESCYIFGYGCVGRYSGAGVDLIFGDDAEHIPAYFCDGGVLSTITIGRNIKSIGDTVFRSCEGLKTIFWNAADCKPEEKTFNYNLIRSDGEVQVIFGKEVERIPEYLFRVDSYSGLTVSSVAIPSGLTEVSPYAFKNCTTLKTVTLGSQITSIGKSAFYGCTALETVNFCGSQKQWEQIDIAPLNTPILSANMVYNYSIPHDDGTEGSLFGAPMRALFRKSPEPLTAINEDSEMDLPEEVVTVSGNTCTVENAVIGKTYMLYVVRSAEDERFLSSENLLYIAQQTAVSDTVAFTFALRESVGTFETVVTSAFIPVSEMTDCAENEHSYVLENILAEASCLQEGCIEYSCEKCGDVRREYTPKTDHMSAIEEGYAATCTSDGVTDKVYCSVCETVISGGEVIPAAHCYGEWSITQKASSSSQGYRERTCSICGNVEGEHTPIMGRINRQKDEWIYVSGNEISYIEYIPSSTGDFPVYSRSDYDTVGYLYDENFTLITSNDDGDVDTNFMFTAHFEKGKTYYIGVGMINGLSGYTTVRVDFPLPSTPIGVGEKKQLEVCSLEEDESTYLKLEIPEDGDYAVWIENIGMVRGTLYNSGLTGAVWHTSSNLYNGNQEYTYSLKAGTYYFYLYEYWDGSSGDTMRTVTLIRACSHDFEFEMSELAGCCLRDLYTCCHCSISYYVNISGNHSYLGEVITPAPCGRWGGEIRYTCTKCGESYTGTYYGEHIYDDGVITTPPTCMQEGEKTFTCTVCGDSYTERVPSRHVDDNSDDICDICGAETVSHIQVNETKTVFVEEGQIVYLKFIPTVSGSYTFCSMIDKDTFGCLLDETFSGIMYDDDSGDNLNFSITADLTAGTVYYWGVKFLDDTSDGDVTVNLVFHSAAECEHAYDRQVVCEASCIDVGLIVYICDLCGDSYSEEIPMKEHVLADWITAEESDCCNSGYRYRCCMLCENVIVSEALPLAPHQYEITVVAPTCQEGGCTYYYCVYCGDLKTEDHTPPVEHNYVCTTVRDATCTRTGLAHIECSECGTGYSQTIPAAGHRFGEWKVITAATAEKEGTEQRICSVCGAKETRAIEKLPQTALESVDESVLIDLVAKRVSMKMKTTAAEFGKMVNGGKLTVTDKNGQALADNALIGTGCIVNIVSDSGEVINSYTAIVRMDTNGDGKANSSDARDVLRVAAKLDTLDGVYALAGDTDGDGKLNSSDARKILRVAAGLDPAQ